MDWKAKRSGVAGRTGATAFPVAATCRAAGGHGGPTTLSLPPQPQSFSAIPGTRKNSSTPSL